MRAMCHGAFTATSCATIHSLSEAGRYGHTTSYQQASFYRVRAEIANRTAKGPRRFRCGLVWFPSYGIIGCLGFGSDRSSRSFQPIGRDSCARERPHCRYLHRAVRLPDRIGLPGQRPIPARGGAVTGGTAGTPMQQGLSPRVRGLKARLIAPELVERIVATYAAEVNAADREQNARRARLTGKQARINRQIRTILDTIMEIGGSRSLVDDLRKLEARQDEIATELKREATPEPLPDLHPNLPAIYRRRIENLEEALRDPEALVAAAESLRTLIDAITLTPENGRGNYRLELRGDLAAFMHLSDAPGAEIEQQKARAVYGAGVFCSRIMGSSVAGTRNLRELALRTAC